MKELVLNVKGMHCEGCENRVKNVIKMIDNVKDVEANHTTGIVCIKYDNEINFDEVKESICDLGFEI